MRKRSRWFIGLVLATGLLATGAVANAGDGNSVKLSARLQGSQEVPAADLDARGGPRSGSTSGQERCAST